MNLFIEEVVLEQNLSQSLVQGNSRETENQLKCLGKKTSRKVSNLFEMGRKKSILDMLHLK